MKHASLNVGLAMIVLFSIGMMVMSNPSDAAPSSFDHKNLGECFESPQAFLREAISENAPSDENIALDNKDAWLWITDRTPSQNFTWYLLQKRSGKYCLRVFVPAASFVEFIRQTEPMQVKAIVAPGPGFAPVHIIFKSQPGTLAFIPARCLLFKNKTGKNHSTPELISCNRAENREVKPDDAELRPQTRGHSP